MCLSKIHSSVLKHYPVQQGKIKMITLKLLISKNSQNCIVNYSFTLGHWTSTFASGYHEKPYNYQSQWEDLSSKLQFNGTSVKNSIQYNKAKPNQFHGFKFFHKKLFTNLDSIGSVMKKMSLRPRDNGSPWPSTRYTLSQLPDLKGCL